jgi:FAD/FMN-containing dehydrogenase
MSIPTVSPGKKPSPPSIRKRARRYGQKLYISGFNNNIDPVGDEFTDLLVIKADRLNTIIQVVPKDFYITVGAGYPLIQINQVIAEEGLWFPFGDTHYPGSSGGALASGQTGSDGSHLVPLSRHLLSITAVLPDGSVVRPGAKTFKSVSGLDISRIFFNSWGALGMIIELTYRVLPLSKQAESPHLSLLPPDREAFVRDSQGDTPLADLCRKIKEEFDPDLLLPVV